LNKLFEVLIWTHKPDEDGRLGDTDRDASFDSYDQAKFVYDNITDYEVKHLMQYRGLEPEADGIVLEENWK
jgi:hypothetical protein